MRIARVIAKKLLPIKHNPNDPIGPNTITHERALGNITIKTGLGTINMNPSELHQIRPQQGGGMELIQIVDLDGSSGAETVFWRFPLFKGWRIEVQGPGIYAGVKGSLPLKLRLIGIGLTKDVVDEKAKEAASFTIEFKLMEDDVLRLCALFAPGIAEKIGGSLALGASSGAAAVLGQAIARAIPVVSALIAISTGYWAYETINDPEASTQDKILAVAHTVADTARIFFPFEAIMANIGLVFASLGLGWYRKWKERQAATPPTGPPYGSILGLSG